MIAIRKIRIVNFKSIKKVELVVDGGTTVFVGQNNAGKSNINKAIDAVFNYRYIPSEYDIYDGIKEGEKCYIDIMMSAITSDKKFETDWLLIFGDKIIENEFFEESFTIRTVISQNTSSKILEVVRFPLLDWDALDFDPNNKLLPREIRKCIGSYYLKSDRDIVDELRVRNSNFSKLMQNANYELTPKDSLRVEKGLDIINRMILRKMPSITEIEKNLSDISTTVENVDNLRILPIPNRFDDLDKGVEILVTNKSSELPISVYGDGTKSWISILSLAAFIKSFKKQLELEGLPYFAIVLLEEPEAHLHPQAQNKVITQLDKMKSQIFITTHSSNIVSELGVFQLFRISNNGNTKLETKQKDIAEEDKLKIINFILPFYTEILFSEKVVFVEGVTDKIIVTDYIKNKMGKKPFEMGVSIVAVNGKDNLPLFREFCEFHSIENIIYADKDASSVISDMDKKGLSLDYVIFTDEEDMEKELLVNQFEVCKQMYLKINKFPDQYILKLELDGRLYDNILLFLTENKTHYPHWLSEYITKSFKLNSLDKMLGLIGRANL